MQEYHPGIHRDIHKEIENRKQKTENQPGGQEIYTIEKCKQERVTVTGKTP